MAKKINLKKVVTKSGEARYYANGKRLRNKSGQRKWVKQNQNLAQDKYTSKELRSLKAIKQYKEGYKFNGRSIQYVYVELLKKMAVPIKKAINNDLATIKDKNGKPYFKNFSDVLRLIDERAKVDNKFLQYCADVGLPNYRGRNIDNFNDRTLKNIVDIVDLLDSKSFKHYTLEVYDTQGDLIRGRVNALLYLRDFEIFVGTEVRKIAGNAAFMRFCYNYKLNIPKREILIDLSDVMKYKDIQDFFDSPTQGKGESIIIDKYKDVEIEINFS